MCAMMLIAVLKVLIVAGCGDSVSRGGGVSAIWYVNGRFIVVCCGKSGFAAFNCVMKFSKAVICPGEMIVAIEGCFDEPGPCDVAVDGACCCELFIDF